MGRGVGVSKKGDCMQRREIKRRRKRTESESEQHSGEQKSGEKEGERTQKEGVWVGGGTGFILMCAQSEGSASAIVPRLPVKTVRLPQCLFIFPPLSEMHKPIITHVCMCKCPRSLQKLSMVPLLKP